MSLPLLPMMVCSSNRIGVGIRSSSLSTICGASGRSRLSSDGLLSGVDMHLP